MPQFDKLLRKCPKSFDQGCTFQSFHCKVASYTKSKPKKVNESRLKKIIENESVTRAKFEIIKRYI